MCGGTITGANAYEERRVDVHGAAEGLRLPSQSPFGQHLAVRRFLHDVLDLPLFGVGLPNETALSHGAPYLPFGLLQQRQDFPGQIASRSVTTSSFRNQL